VSCLTKMLAESSCTRAVTKAVKFTEGADPWMTAREHVAAIPQTEWERLRRLARKRLHRIDVSHPPTQLRADVLTSRPPRPAAVVLDQARSAAIDGELAGCARAVTEGLRTALHAPRRRARAA
jgi:hypothetical protein